jgi:alpha-ribazole phosphatase
MWRCVPAGKELFQACRYWREGVEGRVVHTSPAQRCVEMAKRLAAATGMELRVDERLAGA